MSFLAWLDCMNEKQCFRLLNELIGQIEKQYYLETGSYRITFYTRQDVMICFSIYDSNKSRIRLKNNVLVLYINQRTTQVNYKFKYADFIEAYFDKKTDEFDNLKIKDQVRLAVEILNEIYLDQAVLSTRLL